MQRRFSGKVALITGAARGIGRSIALAFATQGASVVGLDIDQDKFNLAYSLGKGNDLIDTINRCEDLSRSSCFPVFADVSNSYQVKEAVNIVIQELQTIDILVNNAAISTGAQLVHKLSEDDWDKVVDVNLKGVWLCCKYVIPHMIKKKAGRIVNISSIAGLMAFSGYSSYVASKFGVVGLTKTLAIELAEFNINVNAICPGNVATPLNDADALSSGKTLEEGREEFIRGHLFHRLIPPEDIANAVLWLSSEEACNITGSILPVDAGHSTKLPI
jgi:NAD(P)-dependent dehydrogenase (short-subunit alcohol dehydrogenase family)